MNPKTVAVVGFKDSGKTRVVESLAAELSSRGYTVGTLKHTAEDTVFDTPGKDTSRHREAGARATAILHGGAAAIFIDEQLTIQEAAGHLGQVDYLIIEGFKTADTHARVIVPRSRDEVEKLSNGLEVAVANLNDLAVETHVPVFTLDEADKLADLVEEKAYSMLPGMNCHGCGYTGCRELGAAILKGEAQDRDCVMNRGGFSLNVNGEEVKAKGFVRQAMINVVAGFIKTLKGGEDPRKVTLEFEVDPDE